jgi:hypothetical protein
MPPKIGIVIIYLGIILIIIGIVIWSGVFSWFGNLPGDIKIERQSTKIFTPITSIIFLSIILSLAIFLIRKL